MKPEEFQVAVKFIYGGKGNLTRLNPIQTVTKILDDGTILTDLFPTRSEGIGRNSGYASICEMVPYDINVIDSYYSL